nr:MAG TPA: hypothetical protein [Caudoviricetes sp.]DAV57115.1 MAG TPA: hypothetical protein [Caudoviricetes sp.]
MRRLPDDVFTSNLHQNSVILSKFIPLFIKFL